MTGALLGLFVPLISLAVLYLFRPALDGGDWLIWIWPSSLGLMALESRPPLATVVLIYVEVIGTNAIMYAGIAWGGALIYSRIFKPAAE